MSSNLVTAKQNRKFDPTNIKVTADTKWWGFTLHLNEDATQALEDFDDVLAKALKYALGEIPELGLVADAIVAYIKIRNVIIKAEDQGEGVKLVSPWIAPTLLVPLPDSPHVDDSQLRWTVFDEQNGWSDEQKMTQVFSEDGPALAVFQDKLFCVARGGGGDQSLWWMSYDGACDGTGDGTWSTYQQIPRPGGGAGPWSAGAPALAVFQDQIYCVHRGAGNDQSLWWFTFDGNNWTIDQTIPGVGSVYGPWSACGPGLAVFQNKLYCVHRGEGPDEYLWWFSFDGDNWSQDTKNSGATSAYQPAIATYRQPCGTRDLLLCLHRGIRS